MAKVVIEKKTDLERGLYQDAKKQRMSLSAYLETLAQNDQISEEFYNPGRTNKRGEKVSAFKQLLANLGIVTKGPNAATVQEGFFTDKNNRVLFPEYISQTYRELEKVSRNELSLEDIVTTMVPMVGGSYLYGQLLADKEDEPSQVEEMTQFPEYRIVNAKNAVTLAKYGGKLQLSYEALRQASLPVVERYLAKIAVRSRRKKVKRAIVTLLNGDGNSNPAPNTNTLGTSFALEDLIDLTLAGDDNGADPGLIFGDKTEIAALLKLGIISGVTTTFDPTGYRSTGEWPNVVGLTPRKAPKGSILDGSKKLMVYDRNIGLEWAYDPGLDLVETDKIIDGQFEVIVISDFGAFAKPDNDCAAVATHA